MNTTTSPTTAAALATVVPPKSSAPSKAEISAVLARGLKNLWYPLCPSSHVADQPVSIRRLGLKLALWRAPRADGKGAVHALEDHCPHRGAPLSMGTVMGENGNALACPYHGIEVRCDGMVTKVPASPGCGLENTRATASFHIQEAAGAIWLYNAASYVETPPPLNLPPEISADGDWSNFLCYVEWQGDYRYVIDNVMDPMHGTFLHKMSHSMSEGDIHAKFKLRNTPTGFVFEKDGQRDVNFDWTEWADTGTHWMRLEIPYPKTGGPGGSFGIIGAYSPIIQAGKPNATAVFFWRCRKVQGWPRDTWRFLYKNRLEERHWTVLEQDRVMLEAMEPDANLRERQYEHDLGLQRLRQHMQRLALKELQSGI